MNQFIILYRNILLIIVLLSTGIFYSIAWKNVPIMVQDSAGYMRVAIDLQDMKLDKLQERTPGYPLLLLIANSFNKPTRALFYLQLSLHLISVLVLVYLLAHLNTPNKLIVLFLFLSLIPPSVAHTAYILTESLTQFFLVLGFVFLIFWISQSKLRFLIFSSIAIALSAIVRPTYQLLFLLISGLLFVGAFIYRIYRRQLLWASLTFFMISTFIIGGYLCYNYLNFNYFGLTPRFGFHLSTKTVRFIEKLPDKYSEVREILIKNRNNALVERNNSHTGEWYIYQSIPELERVTGLNREDLGNYMVKLNIALIRSAPREYLIEVTRSMSIYWFPLIRELSNFDSLILELFWTILHFVIIAIFIIVLLAQTGFGLVLLNLTDKLKDILMSSRFRNMRLILFSTFISLLIIGYTMVVSTMVDVGSPRHRIPTDLLIFFAISLGIHFWIQMRKNFPKIGSL